jgi:hypothetical protein
MLGNIEQGAEANGRAVYGQSSAAARLLGLWFRNPQGHGYLSVIWREGNGWERREIAIEETNNFKIL